MLKTTITIPTYWARKYGEKGSPEDAIFDHPTPLDQQGTLPRCLESLAALKCKDFQVLIITAPVNPQIVDRVEKAVKKIIAPFRNAFPVIQFGVKELESAQRILESRDLEGGLLSLKSYPNIRNCQLIGALLLDSDLIVAIDDDETVPEDFIDTAVELVGSDFKGKRIDGKAGIYLNSDGDYKIRETADLRSSANIFIRKAALINDTFSHLLSAPERIVETPIALGGNMVFSRELYTSVPHDPNITRGEDIDYLINSRLLGFNWFFDRKLRITHLPPKAGAGDPLNTTPLAKMQQDIIRFIYQRKKIALSHNRTGITPVSPEDLGVYPGEFLKPGLKEQALSALRDTRPDNVDESFFPKPQKLLDSAKRHSDQAGAFFNFARKWPKLIEAVAAASTLRDQLLRKSNL